MRPSWLGHARRVVEGVVLAGTVAGLLASTGIAQAARRPGTTHHVQVVRHLAPIVRVEETRIGEVLATESGLTLYYFTPDKPGHLACQGKCLHIWPPLLVPSSVKKPVIPSGVPGHFGVVARGHDRQLTWDGHPLYTYIGDKKPGDVNGQGFKKLWWAVILKKASTKTTSGWAKTSKTSTKAGKTAKSGASKSSGGSGSSW